MPHARVRTCGHQLEIRKELNLILVRSLIRRQLKGARRRPAPLQFTSFFYPKVGFGGHLATFHNLAKYGGNSTEDCHPLLEQFQDSALVRSSPLSDPVTAASSAIAGVLSACRYWTHSGKGQLVIAALSRGKAANHKANGAE